jgi:DNA-binding CsgD family transcriptional regulator
VLREIADALLESERPIVVAVDDAHLLDDGSAALVLHLAAQSTARVVITIRSGEGCPDAVTALWKEGLATRLELQPLSSYETVELMERVLDGPIEPSVRRRLWTVTAGVPLYLREILHAGFEQGALKRREGVWRWHGELARIGRLGELLGDRLERASTAERRVVELVAMGEPLSMELLAELGCLEALTQAEEDGLVVTFDHDDPAVGFAHPLYGELLRADIPLLVARRHRMSLVRAAMEIGWHERDPLRVASWWLDSGAPGGPADLFLGAARRALALTEWELADRLASAAEVAGAGAEATLMRAAALVHQGSWERADDLLAALAPEALEADLLVEYARFRAGFLAWGLGRPAAARTVLAEGARQLEPPGRARVLAEQAYLALAQCDLAEAGRLAVAAMNDAGPVVELRVQAMAVAALAWAIQGHTQAALQLAEVASPFVATVAAADAYPDDLASLMVPAQGIALVADGRLDEAAELVLPALREPPPNGYDDVDRDVPQFALTVAARLALFQGRLQLAQHYGLRAVNGARNGPGDQWPSAVVAMAAAQQGDLATAEDALRRGLASGPAIAIYTHELALAQAWAAAAQRDLTGARRLAAAAATGAAAAGAPLLRMFALVDLARLGAPSSAARGLGELALVIDGDYSSVAAAYAQAAADRDGDALDAVSVSLEAMGAVLLAAEAAAMAAGAHMSSGRREGQLASLGRAEVLAARCHGARTPALDEARSAVIASLSDRERHVIELAAAGLTNREIAERLYVSVRTVNSHLNHAYRKLGTSDRVLLASLRSTIGSPSGRAYRDSASLAAESAPSAAETGTPSR